MKNLTNPNSKKNQQNKERSSVENISLQNNKPFSDKIVFAIMGIVFLLIYVYIFDKKADLNGDNFAYYALGKSIHDFRGFSSIWAPVASPHNHFPPGYPFILSIGMFISSSPVFLTSINGFLLFISVFLLYKFLNNIGTDQRLSLVISVLLFLNATLLKSSTIY